MDSKMMNITSLHFSPAFIASFLIFQVTPLTQANKDDQQYSITSIILVPVVLVHLNVQNYVHLELAVPKWFKLLGDFDGFTYLNNIRIYIETAVFVMIYYVSLLQVNWSHIWLVIFPVIAIGFILALCNRLNSQNGSQQRDDDEASAASVDDQEVWKEMKKAEGLIKAVELVQYWVLSVMRLFHADTFAVSQFLLFFSFMLGALTLMMLRLALNRAGPGVAPASVLLRKASLVVVLVMVHAVAAELLGEGVVLFCLPEIAPVLLWISIHLDCGKDSVVFTADKIKLRRDVCMLLTAVAVVFLALLAATKDESVFSWGAKALVSCAVSGLLIYYVVFMLCQWPGQDGKATPFLEEAVKLLKFWANALLITAAALLVSTLVVAVRLGLHKQIVAGPVDFFTSNLA